MRLAYKEIKDKKIIKSILQEADHCVIALSDDRSPYLVPMNFGYKDKKLYLHAATDGRKIEILKINNKVSFVVVIKNEIVESEKPCNWGMKYMSVIGEGYAYFIEDYNQKTEALDIIMAKYSNNDLDHFEYFETTVNKMVIIKVDVVKISGKKSGYE
jgi:uncharacterized protein